MNAYSYLRVSSKGQTDGDGFPRQDEAVAKYAAAHDVDVVAAFVEWGVSGMRDMEHRESLMALVEESRRTGVNLVLVEKTDRLGRDLLVLELILSNMRKVGIRVIECAAGTDLTHAENPTTEFIRQLLGAVSQWDKSNSVGRMRAGRERVKAKQAKAGQRVKCGGRHSLRELLAPKVLATLDRMASERYTLARIVEAVAAMHPTTPDGKDGKRKPWRATIQGIRSALGRRVAEYKRGPTRAVDSPPQSNTQGTSDALPAGQTGARSESAS